MTRRIAAGLVVLGLVVALALGVTGWSVVVLASPSMEPFAWPGDLLVQRRVPAEDIEAGDVITVPAPADRLVTHRVARLDSAEDGAIVARLKGDASRLPDPLPVRLDDEVARVVTVVPRIGSVMTDGTRLLWIGLGLLVLGGVALLLARREGSPITTPAGGPPPATTTDAAAPVAQSRLTALLATCEQFASDGMPDMVLRDLVRVRVADLLGLPSAEQAGVVHMLGDGARFYVAALADADRAALALVPTDSERRRRASAALEQWWLVVGRRVPRDVAEQIEPWLSP